VTEARRTPLVSVVMSVFNGQTYLATAIESILQQTFRDFEFLAVDDGSTDRTADILTTYADRDKRMRVFQQPNQGRATSLNDGIKLARGKYLARMDADDISLPDRFAEQVDFMEQHPDVGVLGGAYERITGNGEIIDVIRPPSRDSEIRSVMLHHNPMCHPAIMMRREMVLKSGGYRQALLDADDYDLWLRMCERSKIVNLGSVILQYRIHGNQVSVRNTRHQVLCVLAARKAASIRRAGGPDPLAHIQEINPQVLDSLGVHAEDIEELLIGGYGYWMNALRRNDAEAALTMVEELWKLSKSRFLKRAILADASLIAAGIHYKQGRPKKAIIWTVRALRVRPIVVGRPVKRALTHFARMIKGL
jgi:glycosyltransferase involved in cell wall biosynthesis